MDELAEECQVNRRTIFRDLQAIRDAGYPLLSEREEDGRVLYRFLTGFKKIPPITFSLEELMTLYLCRGQLGFLQGSPFQDDLEAIFSRVRSGLPPRSVAHLERIAEAVAPRFQGIRDYSHKRDILEQLRQALLYQYRCSIWYAPPHREAEEYPLDPYNLLFYKNSLYLAGYAHNRDALRLFLIDRIQQVVVSKDRFDVPEDFGVDQLLGSAFGLIDETAQHVEVRFGVEIAHLIRERTWHPSQRLQDQEDGSVLMTFEAGGEKELLSWLYSYLPHVQVIAPQSLKQSFVEGLKEALSKNR